MADRLLFEIRVVTDLFSNVIAMVVAARLRVVLDGGPASNFEPLDAFAQAC